MLLILIPIYCVFTIVYLIFSIRTQNYYKWKDTDQVSIALFDYNKKNKIHCFILPRF